MKALLVEFIVGIACIVCICCAICVMNGNNNAKPLCLISFAVLVIAVVIEERRKQ